MARNQYLKTKIDIITMSGKGLQTVDLLLNCYPGRPSNTYGSGFITCLLKDDVCLKGVRCS